VLPKGSLDYNPERDSPVKKIKYGNPDKDPIKKFKDKRLSKVKVPYLVTPVKESELVEGYRVSSGLVIESTLYEKYSTKEKTAN
jgi:hypothetical protein